MIMITDHARTTARLFIFVLSTRHHPSIDLSIWALQVRTCARTPSAPGQSLPPSEGKILTTHQRIVTSGSKLSESDIVAMASTPSSAYRPPLGPANPANTLVYFDMKLGRYGEGTKLGRIVMELKSDICPKTAENFIELSQTSYPNSRFHRIIPSFMCQGGDFTNDNGTGGVSIYGARFPDENFTLPHAGPGVLSMANAGPNTNGSQFFICVAATPFLDGKHTVFGQVVEGYEVVKAMEACGSRSGETAYDVMIASSGVLKAGNASAPTQACLGDNTRPSALPAPPSRRAPTTRAVRPTVAKRTTANPVQRVHATRFGTTVSPRMSFV